MIEQIVTLGVYRDGDLEAVVIKNGGETPVIYKVEKMDFDGLKDFLTNLNVPTIKI